MQIGGRGGIGWPRSVTAGGCTSFRRAPTAGGIEEHAFNPVRARVAGGDRVRFLNNGQLTHTIAARDGSWFTGPIRPAAWTYVTLEEPGTFLYHCTVHPWAIGEITVEP